MKTVTFLIHRMMFLFFMCGGVVASDEAGEWGRVELLSAQAPRGHLTRQMTARIIDLPESRHEPVLEITLWQGECRMNVNLREVTSRAMEAAVNPVAVLTGARITHRIFAVPGGLEWEISLAGRPSGGKLVFDIEIGNLNFYRQDSLSEFERHSLGARRPDSVVGAWVAYHGSKAHDHRVVADGDTICYDYGTGQAFIVYRPRAWDSDDTVWCDLSIDPRQGIMTIAVDSAWLDAAEYPVTIDPTFGNTDIGASTISWNQYFAYCHSLAGTNTYTVPSGRTATGTGYSVYGCETGAGDLGVSMAAFNIIDGCPGDRAGEPAAVNVSGGTPKWFSCTTPACTLRTSEEYGVAISCAPRSGGTLYYNSVTGATSTDNTNCALNAGEWTPATFTEFNFSMYATFTEEEINARILNKRRRKIQAAFNTGRAQ